MSVLPGSKAPWFSSTGYQDGKFMEIKLSDFSSSGKWLILFFYPLDFGYISPSELMELEKKRNELERLDCKIVAISRDSAISHEKFVNIHPGYGGVNGIKFPLLEDLTGSISRLYGVSKKRDGHSFRAYFIIDSKEVVRARVVGDLPVGLGIEEMLRQLKALKLAVTGVCVDEEGSKICDAVSPRSGETNPRRMEGLMKTGLTKFKSDKSYYNQTILKEGDYPNSSGNFQSPVNIITSEVIADDTLDELIFKYVSVWDESIEETPDTPQHSLVKNTGRSWQVDVPLGHQLLLHGGPLKGREYRLDHYVAHWGESEHMLNGKSWDGELQLVHCHVEYHSLEEALRHDKGVAIVGVMLKATSDGESNTELEKIGEILNKIQHKGQVAKTAEPVEMTKVLPKRLDYVTYSGSLSVPPFQEKVVWIILEEEIPVRQELINRMKDLKYGEEGSYKMTNNARFIHSLDGRKVARPMWYD